MSIEIASKLNTPCITITTRAFSQNRAPEKVFVIVDEFGEVCVFDTIAGYFTRCHSITRQVAGVIRARWAKAFPETA